jgi:hypothetical protein
VDISSKEYLLKSMEISGELLDIADNRDDFARGDLQGAIEAQVMIAIQYGYDTAKKEANND